MKRLFISLLIFASSITATAQAAQTTVCGLLSSGSPGAALNIQYFITFAKSPGQTQKVELVAQNQLVARFLSKALQGSAVCAAGERLDSQRLLTVDIKEDRIGF